MNTNNQITPTSKAESKQTKRKISGFIKTKNKKSKLSTYTFNPNDPSTVTPIKTMKDLTLTQMNAVTVKVLSEKPPPPKKSRFEVGGIVMINGHHFDHYKFSSVQSAPTLYGIVHVDQTMAGPNETNIEVVASGEYEWLNKNLPHTLTASYSNHKLKKYTGPPRTLTERVPYSEDDPIRLFTPTEEGWIVKSHEAPCYQCADPWCMLNQSRRLFKKMVATVKDEATGMEAQKELRFKCYRQAIHEKYGYLGVKERKRTGYCFERLVRESFPESDARYAGYAKLDGSNTMADFHNFNV